ncbi:hypothetical protein JB92DRAFT_2828287 [Gautieria morchelliformis]|nr:hypothetical protein JB92DRAFT_2828287 [Gautieria morchelliformis]
MAGLLLFKDMLTSLSGDGCTLGLLVNFDVLSAVSMLGLAIFVLVASVPVGYAVLSIISAISTVVNSVLVNTLTVSEYYWDFTGSRCGPILQMIRKISELY